jgi:hypothetical protein
VRKFSESGHILPTPSGRLSIFEAEKLRKEFRRLLRVGIQEKTYFVDGSNFQTVRDCFKDRSFLEDGTELEAYMQVAMFEMIRRHSRAIVTMPLDTLRRHEPVSFRPTDLFPTEFEVYTVTADMYNDVTEKYATVAGLLDPTDTMMVAYSSGLFSGFPINEEAANQ